MGETTKSIVGGMTSTSSRFKMSTTKHINKQIDIVSRVCIDAMFQGLEDDPTTIRLCEWLDELNNTDPDRVTKYCLMIFDKVSADIDFKQLAKDIKRYINE